MSVSPASSPSLATPPLGDGDDAPPALRPGPVAATSAAIDQTDIRKWQRLIVIITGVFLMVGVVALAIRLLAVIHHTVLLFALGALVAYALDPLVELLRHPGRGKQAGPEVGQTPATANDVSSQIAERDRARASGGQEQAGRQKGLSRKGSVALVFLLLLAVVVGGIAWLGHEAVRQATTLRQDFPQYRQRAIALAQEADARLAARHVQIGLADKLQHPPAQVTASAGRLGRQALPILAHGAATVGESVIVLLIALYFLLFGAELKEGINRNLPPALLEHAVPWETDVNRIVGGFVRGQLLIALISGALAAAGCLIVGIHLWLIIGLFVVFAALIPVFGPYIGAVPAIIAALIGPTHFSPIVSAVIVLVLFIVINEGGSKVLYPKLVGQALGLHEMVVLFVIFAGLEIDGIVGTLFAAPVTALALVSIVHLYRYWQGLPENLLANVARRAAPEAKQRKLA